jgi:hypothetical protein
MRVDRPDGKPGFFYNYMDQPSLASTQWRAIELVGEVAADAEDLNYGVMQKGAGVTFVDATAVEVVPLTTQLTEAPRNPEPTNLDFEGSIVGDPPAGWSIPWSPDPGVHVSDHAPHGGTRCLEIGTAAAQRIDATRWRGRTVRVAGFARASTPTGASIVVTVEGDPSERPSWFFDRTVAPVPPMTWRDNQIDVAVNETARTLAIEVYADSDAKAWVDDLSITVVE